MGIQLIKITTIWLLSLTPLMVVGFLLLYKTGLMIALIIGLIALFLMLRISSEYVLHHCRAKLVTDTDNVIVSKAISRLAFLLNIPTPSFYLINDKGPVAFCAKSYAGNGKVVLRRDFIADLSQDELQAVLANLLSKLSAKDSVPLTLIAAVSIIHEKMVHRIVGLMQRISFGDDSFAVAIGTLLRVLMYPFIDVLTGLHISKKFFFRSDKQSVQLIFDHRALESALLKAEVLGPSDQRALDSLSFVAPERLGVMSFSSKIPMVAERLKVLEQA